ncbi:MAG TPA: hypothetical protein VFS40_14175 [Gemmatimonadales bacterium]|nr:hypothetical protein [Gemmatimonadales bacterium]
MSTRGKAIAWLVALGFVGFLLWTTLRGQKAECEVCVEYAGGRNCATASHESEAEAARSAQTTACGPLARGMNETIACQNRPPVRRVCRTAA